MSSDEKSYYLAIDGKQEGPFTLGQLEASLTAGAITRAVLAWHEGLTDWVQLGTLVCPPPPPVLSIAPPPLPVAVHKIVAVKSARKITPQPPPGPKQKEYTLIVSDAGRIDFSVTSLQGAKDGLQEMKLQKRAYQVLKKKLQQNLQIVRGNYTRYTQTRGRMFRGGRGLGRFFRWCQAVSRDGKKRGLAHDLLPIQKEIHRVETIILSFDQAILQLTENIRNFVPD